MESASAKVVLVTDQHPRSGIGVYVTRLHDLLQERFPQVEVRNLHYFPYPDSPPHRPVAGQRYAGSRIGVLGALRHNEHALARELGGTGTLVHLCGASYDLAALVERPIATVHDFGLQSFGSLGSVQGRLILVEAYAMVEWLRTPRYLRRCRRLISVSAYTRDRLRDWTGLDSTVIPHWIDPDRFHPRSKAGCRERLGLPLDRRILLSVTSGRAYKNAAMLGRVLAALPPEYLLVKVGYPLAGPPARVRNEGGVTDDRYPLYFAASDAYIHLSFREGFGIPLLEAMGSGTPVVALGNPPAPEVLAGAGLLLPPRTGPAECAAALRSVVETGEVAERLRAAGLARSRTFAPAAARDRLAEIYLDAMRS